MTTKTSTTNNYTDKLPDFVHIFSVEDHDYWKPKLLEAIEQMKEINNIRLNNEGYYYDYDISEANRTYKNLMDNIVLSSINELEETYGLKLEFQPNYWFQQYLQGSKFGWHQHNAHWAMVYYIELPEMSESTEFLNFGQFNVKEGDIIFFPSFLIHRSPIIKSNLRKTIISGNYRFIVNRELIENYGEKYFRN